MAKYFIGPNAFYWKGSYYRESTEVEVPDDFVPSKHWEARDEAAAKALKARLEALGLTPKEAKASPVEALAAMGSREPATMHEAQKRHHRPSDKGVI